MHEFLRFCETYGENMAKTVYVCASPYQVIGATLLQLERREDARIVVINKFGDSERLCGKLKEEGIFSKVIGLDETRIWESKTHNILKKRISTIKTYLTYKKIVERIVPEIMSIEHLFVSSRGAIARLFCMYAAENIPGAKIHYYDDGMGSYTNKEVNVKKIDILLRRLLVGKKSVEYTFDRFLYSPQFYSEINRKDPCIHSMPKFTEQKELINRLFDYDESARIEENIIVFDGLLEDDFTEYGKKLYKGTIEKLIQKSKDVIIKPHPRAPQRYFSAPYYEGSGIPFEVLCANDSYGNKVMITCMSTSVFTPKMIFDQEPVIILLYKIFDKDWKMRDRFVDRLCDSIRKIYRMPQKVIVPTSMEEFEESIREQGITVM